jgi:hypothetical protein
MDEPPVQVFMQEYQELLPDRLDAKGGWRTEIDYPCPGLTEKTFFLAEHNTLTNDRNVKNGLETARYFPQVGIAGGLWSGGIMFGLPSDQRQDEAFSLQFDTQPLEESLSILGRPMAEVYTSSSANLMGYVAKVNDLAPDGTSSLVAKGAMNISRRNSLASPEQYAKGEIIQLSIPIDCTGYVFEKGHKIRLSISFADFPNLWPTPESGINTVYFGQDHPSRLILPVVPPSGSAQPVRYRASKRNVARHKDNPVPPVWEITTDQLSGSVTSRIRFSTDIEPEENVKIHHESEGLYQVDPEDPARVTAHGWYQSVLTRPAWVVKGNSKMSLLSTATDFYIEINLEVFINEKLKHSRKWEKKFPRHLL